MTAAPVVIRPPVPEPVFEDWADFYDSVLRHLFGRDPELEPAWCPSWEEHYAATFCVDGLWRAWEQLQRDPGAGVASWLVNLAVPAMRELLAEGGCFAGCSSTKHTPLAVSLP
jgi:hypothetical protein